MGRNKKRGGSGPALQSNACVRALPERSEGIRYVRRNGAHSVSDCVEKAWRQRSRDIDGGDMPALCVAEEKKWVQVHDGAESGAGAA